jgi:hypothetical protein
VSNHQRRELINLIAPLHLPSQPRSQTIPMQVVLPGPICNELRCEG